MIPTRLIRQNADELEGPELDQLLVYLYTEHWREREASMPRENRTKHFESWLQGRVFECQEAAESARINSIFASELPELRSIWERVMQEASGDNPQLAPRNSSYAPTTGRRSSGWSRSRTTTSGWSACAARRSTPTS